MKKVFLQIKTLKMQNLPFADGNKKGLFKRVFSDVGLNHGDGICLRPSFFFLTP
jgi:hypothetical protein